MAMASNLVAMASNLSEKFALILLVSFDPAGESIPKSRGRHAIDSRRAPFRILRHLHEI